MSATHRIELHLTPAQIDQLREVMDGLPLNRYAPLIVVVLRALPMLPCSHPSKHVGANADGLPECSLCGQEIPESVASGADAGPRVPLPSSPPGPVGSFRLEALTDRGRAGLAEVERILAPLLLPHGDNSL